MQKDTNPLVLYITKLDRTAKVVEGFLGRGGTGGYVSFSYVDSDTVLNKLTTVATYATITVGTPTLNEHAATKRYVDDTVATLRGTVNGLTWINTYQTLIKKLAGEA